MDGMMMIQQKVKIKNPDFSRRYRSYTTFNLTKSISINLKEMQKYYKK
jgi:hypothetical protein